VSLSLTGSSGLLHADDSASVVFGRPIGGGSEEEEGGADAETDAETAGMAEESSSGDKPAAASISSASIST
jgi:hypothetical protein